MHHAGNVVTYLEKVRQVGIKMLSVLRVLSSESFMGITSLCLNVAKLTGTNLFCVLDSNAVIATFFRNSH